MEYRDTFKMRETSEFKKIEDQIRQKNEEMMELFKQLEREFPIGPHHYWGLMLSGDVFPHFNLPPDEDYEL